MIVYTAWDSLRAIAHDQNGQLMIVPGEGMSLFLHPDSGGSRFGLTGVSARTRSIVARLGHFGR
ncbi:MAG: hypothetical protein U0031_09365 [Thermomicrobiales bacterium]